MCVKKMKDRLIHLKLGTGERPYLGLAKTICFYILVLDHNVLAVKEFDRMQM